jgi:uncharacterized protein (TIGR03083 family)
MCTGTVSGMSPDTSGDTIHDAYREARERLTVWARELGDDQVAAPVPALPGWTVGDTFAHLAGLCSDVNEGRTEGIATDPWTAKQVADRSGWSLHEVLAEWGREGPRFEANLAELGKAAPIQVVIDIWSHEVDIRSALGVVIPDGGAAERFLNRAVRRGLGRGWPGDTGVPPLRIVTEDDEWVIGGDEPVGSLSTTWFELGRVMLGRRSPTQMAALAWSGADPSLWIAAIPVFGPSEVDVVDSSRTSVQATPSHEG